MTAEAVDQARAGDLRQTLVEAVRSLSAQGLNRGTSGNVSVRLGAGMLITPSGMTAEALAAEDIVYVDGTGRASGRWKPSSEWRFHHDILARRADIQAVVHTHAVHATAIAMCGEPIPAVHYMVAAAGGDVIDCAHYALFGTQALSDAVLVALGDRMACLMANHGMIACGASVEKAVWLAAEVETLAHQYVLARQFAVPRTLDAQQMQSVHARFADYGQAREQEA